LNTDDSEHLMNKLDEDREKFDEYMEEQVYLQFKKLCNSKWTHWTTYVPTAWLSTEGAPVVRGWLPKDGWSVGSNARRGRR
jgi:hypothetical protein